MKRSRWLGALVLGGLLFYALLGDIPLHGETRSGIYFKNFLHFPLGILFYGAVHFLFIRWIKAPGLFICSIAAQGLFELFQPMVGRTASWLDLGLAVMGTLFLWCCLGWLPRLQFRKLRAWAAGAILLLALAPGIVLLGDERQQVKELPKISNFDRWIELTRWEEQGGERRRALWSENKAAGYGLVFTVGSPENYPGVFCNFHGQDWSAYKKLSMRVILKGQPSVLLTVRLDDLEEFAPYAKRLDETVSIAEGENHIAIDIQERTKPNGEPFNLAQIERTIIHLSGAVVGTQILLDDIQLH